MKAIIFGYDFDAPDELKDFIKSLGYDNFDYRSFDIMFDSRVVEFCEQRLSPLWDEMVYKGKKNTYFRCGFAGAGYIRNIDICRKWNIKYNHVDAPIINYVDVSTNKYGYTKLINRT